jgi:hypothetical protein
MDPTSRWRDQHYILRREYVIPVAIFMKYHLPLAHCCNVESVPPVFLLGHTQDSEVQSRQDLEEGGGSTNRFMLVHVQPIDTYSHTALSPYYFLMQNQNLPLSGFPCG